MADAIIANDNEPVYRLYELVLPDTKSYWGITQGSTEDRFWNGHVRQANGGKMRPICCAIRKYGVENVQVYTRAIGRRDYIKELEITAIAAFRTNDRNHGYNVNLGGDLGTEAGSPLWITDGLHEHRIYPNDIVPIGWHYGRSPNGALRGFNWINNGYKCIHLKNGDELPEGWILGRIWGRESRWINNGTECVKLKRNEILPDGWVFGRIFHKVIERGDRWINNGTKCILLKNGKDLPKGWRFGRILPNEPVKGWRWINNGSENVQLKAGDELPQGWTFGMGAKGRWVNNGVENVMLKKGQDVTEGWSLGMMPKKKKT